MHSLDPMSVRFVEAALRDSGMVEHRALAGGRAVSRLCRSVDDVRAAVAAVPGANHYATLNRPHPGEYPRRALTDADIAVVTRLPFDFDPVRPKGTNASHAKLRAAEAVKNRFVAYVCAMGFPAPVQAMSGNGYHAIFRCRLDSTPELHELLTRIYRALAGHFSTPEVTFDTTVRNPSRILRLYGTRNVKGLHTEDRPQRVASVWCPSSGARSSSATSKHSPLPSCRARPRAGLLHGRRGPWAMATTGRSTSWRGCRLTGCTSARSVPGSTRLPARGCTSTPTATTRSRPTP